MVTGCENCWFQIALALFALKKAGGPIFNFRVGWGLFNRLFFNRGWGGVKLFTKICKETRAWYEEIAQIWNWLGSPMCLGCDRSTYIRKQTELEDAHCC